MTAKGWVLRRKTDGRMVRRGNDIQNRRIEHSGLSGPVKTFYMGQRNKER
jgi:hypothetical protein